VAQPSRRRPVGVGHSAIPETPKAAVRRTPPRPLAQVCLRLSAFVIPGAPKASGSCGPDQPSLRAVGVAAAQSPGEFPRPQHWTNPAVPPELVVGRPAQFRGVPKGLSPAGPNPAVYQSLWQFAASQFAGAPQRRAGSTISGRPTRQVRWGRPSCSLRACGSRPRRNPGKLPRR